MAARERELELEFLASGATQHVFRHEDAFEEWVYKTPAFMEALLPSVVGLADLRPDGLARKLAFAACYRVPRACLDWLLRSPLPGRRQLVSPVHVLARPYTRFLSGVARRYFRRARITGFRRMLATHRALAELRIAHEALLPFHTLDHGVAYLNFESGRHRYRGPILMQRRADVFYELFDPLDSFDWRQMVDVQHRLWRHGVGVADADAVLGPAGWALWKGRVLLGDTGSLTRERRTAWRTLAPALLDEREAYFISRMPASARPLARQRYAEIRSRLDREIFAKLWALDLRHTSTGALPHSIQPTNVRPPFPSSVRDGGGHCRIVHPDGPGTPSTETSS